MASFPEPFLEVAVLQFLFADFIACVLRKINKALYDDCQRERERESKKKKRENKRVNGFKHYEI